MDSAINKEYILFQFFNNATSRINRISYSRPCASLTQIVLEHNHFFAENVYVVTIFFFTKP